MVRRITDDGKGAWHEPPYTEEEEMEIYRMLDGPMSTLRAPSNPFHPSPPPKTPRPPRAK
jgi:hypothetical protein